MEMDRSDRGVCLAVDAQGYSKRLESEQGPLQEALSRMVYAAGNRVVLPVDRWNVQPQGDGLLILAPLDNDEPRYADDFVRQLGAELARHNRNLVEEARIRMRVVLHHGVAYPGANGFVGDAVVLACRLLDSQISRDALASGRGDLVLILSESMYVDNILAERTTFDPDDFAPVDLEEEKVSTRAWIWSPDPVVVRSLKEARARKANGAKNGALAAVQRAETINNIEKIRKIETAYFGTVLRQKSDDD